MYIKNGGRFLTFEYYAQSSWSTLYFSPSDTVIIWPVWRWDTDCLVIINIYKSLRRFGQEQISQLQNKHKSNTNNFNLWCGALVFINDETSFLSSGPLQRSSLFILFVMVGCYKSSYNAKTINVLTNCGFYILIPTGEMSGLFITNIWNTLQDLFILLKVPFQCDAMLDFFYICKL